MAKRGNIFNTVKMSAPNTNSFDLSHDVKLSMNMGELIPILALECVPGDRHNISAEALIRMAPMIAPMMHRVDVTIHYFFVPNRIIWSNWEKFITNDPTNPAAPYIILDETYYNSQPLFDYMGCPDPGPTGTHQVSALPFQAYQKIWQEYYRDQNLIPDNLYVELVNGNNAGTTGNITDIRKRAWEHDYFTSCLPFAQKGAAVDLPLNFTDVEVHHNHPADPTGFTTLEGVPDDVVIPRSVSPEFPAVDELIAQTSDLTGSSTINDLRRAYKLQEFLEKLARGGSRMTEFILSIFGVRSSDARLNRPEYITGTKAPMQISEVLNTSDTENAPQGNMAGHGISVTNGKNGSYYCEEHGWIIGIMSVLPRTCYQQGLARHFQKFDNLDYFTPQFANIGEQEVYNKEIYLPDGIIDPESVFGYNPRYSEYKFMSNRVAGDFKTTLDFWHMGRIFATAPALNQVFIEADPTTRIYAVEDEESDKLYCQIYNNIQSTRKMPKYGTPTF